MKEQTPYVILAAVDFSHHSQRALDSARDLASRTPHAELHVVHVVPPPVGTVTVLGTADMAATFTDTLDRTRKELEAACGEAAKGLSERVFGHVRTGKPSREIAEVAKQIGADLIVIGTHGRTGLARVLLGSVTEEVVRQAPCDVLTVRVPEPVPEIEAACPACVEAQKSGGPKARCAQHSLRHPRPHTYADGREGLFHQSFKF